MSMFRKVCVCAYGKSYGPFYGLEGHGRKLGGERSPYERAELSHRAHCRCPGPSHAGGATPGLWVVQQQAQIRVRLALDMWREAQAEGRQQTLASLHRARAG